MPENADCASGIGAARLAYTMIRVSDLARSVAFYTNILGMKLFRQEDFPEGEFTLAFLGYGGQAQGATVELTYNWGLQHYDLGNGFGHIAIAVPDVHRAAEQALAAGGALIRPAGPMRGGTEIIAFLRDPDGYKIELVQDHTLTRDITETQERF